MVKPPGAVARRRRTAVCPVSLFNPRVTVSVWPPEFVALIVMIAESEPEKVPAPFVLATNKPRVAVFVVLFPTPQGGISCVGGPPLVPKIKKLFTAAHSGCYSSPSNKTRGGWGERLPHNVIPPTVLRHRR